MVTESFFGAWLNGYVSKAFQAKDNMKLIALIVVAIFAAYLILFNASLLYFIAAYFMLFNANTFK